MEGIQLMRAANTPFCSQGLLNQSLVPAAGQKRSPDPTAEHHAQPWQNIMKR